MIYNSAYSNREKAIALSLVEEKMKNERISLPRAASEINVPLSSIYRWRADANLPDLSSDSSDITERNKNHQGPDGYLDDIKDKLILFITEWRDRGFPVSRFSVVQKGNSVQANVCREITSCALYVHLSLFAQEQPCASHCDTHLSETS